MTDSLNHRVVLASRPDGRPRPSDFRVEHVPIPEPQNGVVSQFEIAALRRCPSLEPVVDLS